MRYRNIKKPVRIDDKNNKRRIIYNSEKAKNISAKNDTSLDDICISKDIEENYKVLKEIFADCADITYRRFIIGKGTIKCLLLHIEGIINNEDNHENVLKSMMKDDDIITIKNTSKENELINVLKDSVITVGETKELKNMKESIEKLLDGFSVLFVDKNTHTLAINLIEPKGRGVGKPETQVTVRGPQESFVENIKINTVLIRRRIKTSKLKMENFEVGEVTKTKVIISYINGMAKEETVDLIRKRIKDIKIDAIIDSADIEFYLEDKPSSPFPQTGITERPDCAVGALLEGRICIFVDGSPFSLVVPTVFVHFLTASEDYYERFYFASLVRLLRYVTFDIALLGPSVYIAVTTFHQEMIPTSLLTTIANSRAQVPFPAIIEALLMEFMFEILREAGIRLPKNVGQAVSIVGALVIGDAAVNAGLVSTPMVLAVAVTGIASFTIPGYNAALTVRMLRFIIMVLASAFGLYGVVLGVLLIMFHMSDLTSAGVLYLSPITPAKLKDWKDVFIRLPKGFVKNKG